jgi:hypothetical protein
VQGWRDTLVPMIEKVYHYRRVKVELKIEQTEDGGWGGRYKLTWSNGSTEEFFTKRDLPTSELAKDSARDEARYYIDQRKGPIKSG